MFSNDGEIPEALAKRKAVVDPILANGLNFDAYDLEANRQSVLTSHQKQILMEHKAREVWSKIGFFIFIGVVSSGGILLVAFQNVTFSTSNRHFISNFIVILLAPLFILAIYMIQTYSAVPSIRKDIKNGIVQSHTGMVRLDKNVYSKNGKSPYKSPSSMRFLVINNQEFNVSHEGYPHFNNRTRYTIYYAPHSKIILSAEPV